MAKTQYSFSDDQNLLGAPKGFRITVRNLKVSAGAGFLVALTGDIMTMPGLPRVCLLYTSIALEMVGLGDKLQHKPSQLSGGQQQRVSIARALVGEPAVILADEPTGALDSKTGREVLSLLQELHAAGNTVVLITHDNSIAVQAQRIIRLEDGRVVYDGPSNAPEAVVTPRAAGTGGGASA